jgi:hypothetical protein
MVPADFASLGQRSHDRIGDSALDGQRIANRLVIALRPVLDSAPPIHQLRPDPDRGRRPPHASGQDMIDPQPVGHSRKILRVAELFRRHTPDHPQPPDLRQGAPQLFRNPVRKKRLGGVTRQVREGQHDDARGPVIRSSAPQLPCPEPADRERRDARQPADSCPAAGARRRLRHSQLAGPGCVPCQLADSSSQARDPRISGTALPVRQVGRLKLPEPQWRQRAVDLHRQQPTPVAPMPGLVPHPGRFHRGCRPYDNHDIGRIQLALDILGKLAARLDGGVPPDSQARTRQRLGQPCHTRPVRTRIRQEHPSLPNLVTCLHAHLARTSAKPRGRQGTAGPGSVSV